eukprot:jgi/Mesen1/8428/ME000473S07773
MGSSSLPRCFPGRWSLHMVLPLLVVFIGISATSTSANHLSNGGFEQAGISVRTVGQQTVYGWGLTHGGVRVLDNEKYFAGLQRTPAGRSVQLPLVPGKTIFQEIDTLARHAYAGSFNFEAPSLESGQSATVLLSVVDADSGAQIFLDLFTERMTDEWVTRVFKFTAISARTLVTFASAVIDGAGNSTIGPVLDNIVIDALDGKGGSKRRLLSLQDRSLAAGLTRGGAASPPSPVLKAASVSRSSPPPPQKKSPPPPKKNPPTELSDIFSLGQPVSAIIPNYNANQVQIVGNNATIAWTAAGGARFQTIQYGQGGVFQALVQAPQGYPSGTMTMFGLDSQMGGNSSENIRFEVPGNQYHTVRTVVEVDGVELVRVHRMDDVAFTDTLNLFTIYWSKSKIHLVEVPPPGAGNTPPAPPISLRAPAPGPPLYPITADYSCDNCLGCTGGWCNAQSSTDGSVDIVVKYPAAGARFSSQNVYATGFFSADIKCSANHTEGLITSFYTNVYIGGVGGNEAIHDLGFDCSADFHNYAIWYTQKFIIWYIDRKVVRIALNTEATDGTPYPHGQMHLYASVWDASSICGGCWTGYRDPAYKVTGWTTTMSYRHMTRVAGK